MNSWQNLILLTFCHKLVLVTAAQLEMTAISHTNEFYHNLRTEDEPSETDPARSDATFRKRMCQIITESEFFRVWQVDSISTDRLLSERELPQYVPIFREIFHPTSSGEFTYANEYRLREFARANSRHFAEHVFICPTEDKSSLQVIPLYISKEYNLSPPRYPYKPGRFIFGNLVPQRLENKYHSVMVAEEPATAHTQLEFNVEHYYLRQRRHTSPAVSNKIDPLCKLISEKKFDSRNEHHRLCVAALRSSYFVHRFKYPRKKSYSCELVSIFFQTAEGRSGARGKSYRERMTLCSTTFIHPEEGQSHFYVSRAYKSNQVFVYRRHEEDGQIYLENISSNIRVIDELNSFDFVEDRRRRRRRRR